MTPDRPDVFSWLLDDFVAKGKPSRQDQLNLVGDAALIAIAGRSVDFDHFNRPLLTW